MTRESNGLPAWVKGVGFLVGTVGVPAFLALYLAGALSGFLPSPIAAHEAALRQHEENTAKLLRLLCVSAWRGEADMQRKCLE